ncbi:DUF1129 family protein [Enterococcus sp. BWR-S5]|uniref:DUF1129 family protein n=1 Tax=Enterococcus sp. BWR-S5 TaxID=2787714 RepID=UPI001922BBED|nr:DUF1129 family protein [Enterococcus sp. BWR-S5]MBL1224417.1 DUF1129 family protein [Enterococcus sp. BWR-S5]
MDNKQIAAYREGANAIEDKLTGSNKQFFSDLRLYLLTATIFSDEGEINQQLYELGSDLLEAQNNGQDAEEYFGANAKEMADDLLRYFKKGSTKEHIKLSVLFIGVFWLFRLVGDFTGSRPIELNVLEYLLSAIFAGGMSLVVFKYLHHSIYAKTGFFKPGKKRSALIFILAAIFTISVFVFIQLFTPSIWMVRIP